MNGLFEDYFNIKQSEITFNSLLGNENLSQERVNELKYYHMLIIPIRDYRNNEGYFFYSASRDFYLFCKNENPENHFEFYTEKNEYKELLLNSSELYLGTLLINHILLPIASNLLLKFITEKLTNNDDKVILKIIIENNETNSSEEIEFRGTKKDFKEKIIKTLNTYTKDGKTIVPGQNGTKINVLY